MLFRYDNKRVRITTEQGDVFTGIADVCSSGYGLHEFDRMEESLRIDDRQIFRSDIRKIEVLPERWDPLPASDQLDARMGDLLEGPCLIVDILPGQVPRDAPGQYFTVERYYLQPEHIRPLRRRFAEILLRLNCYYDMSISFDDCRSWETNPDPEAFARRVEDLSGNSFLRVLFEGGRAMIDLEHDDTYLTVYDPDHVLHYRLQKLAEAEGLFVWSPPDNS